MQNRMNVAMMAVICDAIAVAVPAQAGSYKPADYAVSAGDILVHGRMLGVFPDADADTTGAVTVRNALEIGNHYVPEIDATYYFTPHWGVEVIAAVSPHDVSGINGAVNGLDFGRVWLLPPTATVKYQFSPIGGFGYAAPYIGAGVNVTHFFDAGGWNKAVIENVDYGTSVGPALQAGVDVPLSKNWVFNLDIKKIWIKPDVDVTLVGGAHVYADTHIDPLVAGVGVGYKF